MSHEVIVNLTAATTTRKGLTVRAEIDDAKYEKGIKVSDTEFAAIRMARDELHGEWNYVISPTLHRGMLLFYAFLTRRRSTPRSHRTPRLRRVNTSKLNAYGSPAVALALDTTGLRGESATDLTYTSRCTRKFTEERSQSRSGLPGTPTYAVSSNSRTAASANAVADCCAQSMLPPLARI